MVLTIKPKVVLLVRVTATAQTCPVPGYHNHSYAVSFDLTTCRVGAELVTAQPQLVYSVIHT